MAVGEVLDPICQPFRFRLGAFLNVMFMETGHRRRRDSAGSTAWTLDSWWLHVSQMGRGWRVRELLSDDCLGNLVRVCRDPGRGGPEFRSCLWPAGLGPWATSKPSSWCLPSAARPPCAGHPASKLPSARSVLLPESGRWGGGRCSLSSFHT